MHKKDPEKRQTYESESDRRCRFCERTYLSEQDLEQHLEESHPEQVSRQGSENIWPRLR